MRKLTVFHTIRKFTERAKLIWQKKLAADITKCLFFLLLSTNKEIQLIHQRLVSTTCLLLLFLDKYLIKTNF